MTVCTSLAVPEPLVDRIEFLVGKEHRGDLDERMLGTFDDLHIIKRTEAPFLSGLLETQRDIEIVGFEDYRPEFLKTQLLRGHRPVVSVHDKISSAPLDEDERLRG